MADIGIWGLGAIASPAATDRLPLESGVGAGGYSTRGEFVWKDASGNYICAGPLGIGTTTPAALFEIAGVSGAAKLFLTETGVRRFSIRAGTAASGVFDIADETSAASRLAITAAGNVVVGGTASSFKFSVKGAQASIESSTNSDGNLRLINTGQDWLVGMLGAPGSTALSFYNITAGALRMAVSAAGVVTPGADNSQTLGSASFRWSTVYAGTGTINTCDVRFKTFRTDRQLREAEHAAALALFDAFGFYQFNDAIEAKGADGARWHFGPAAQEAYTIWADHGLCAPLVENDKGEMVPPPDAVPPAFMCFDLIEEERSPVNEGWRPSAVLGSDGQPVMVKCAEGEEATEMRPTGETVVTREAGHIFGVRIDQLHSIMIAAINAERKAHASRLTALENLITEGE